MAGRILADELRVSNFNLLYKIYFTNRHSNAEVLNINTFSMYMCICERRKFCGPAGSWRKDVKESITNKGLAESKAICCMHF